MFVPSAMTKTGKPTAFLPATFTKDRWGYHINAFWIPTRTTGSRTTPLAYGTVTAEFKHAGYENLSYADFLQLAAVVPDPESYKKISDVSHNPKVILDTESVWAGPVTSNLHVILKSLLEAQPNLPATPQGTDGWYRLKS